MTKIKYPRTNHLPWSKNKTDDDLYLTDISYLESLEDVIVSEKIDGQNTSMYTNYLHARSLDSTSHLSQSYVRKLHSEICYLIPENVRICGENVYGRHSIYYDKLTSYFYVYAIFETNDKHICWSWDRTVEFCKSIGLETVPLLYRGKFDIDKVKECFSGKSMFGDVQEGYVIRNANSFLFNDFNINVAKYVNKNFMIGNEHWTKNWNSRNINIDELINKLK